MSVSMEPVKDTGIHYVYSLLRPCIYKKFPDDFTHDVCRSVHLPWFQGQLFSHGMDDK